MPQTNHYSISEKEYFMKPLKNKISITLDSDIIEILKKEAEEDDRSFSQYINLIHKEYIRNKKESQNSDQK